MGGEASHCGNMYLIAIEEMLRLPLRLLLMLREVSVDVDEMIVKWT
jgi:hypothetical protein